MAITIITKPPTHTPGYNEQYFVASGTNTGQPNFRYRCSVLIDSELVTFPLNPRPGNGWVYFNPQKVAESYLQNKWDSAADRISLSSDSIKLVTVGIDEEYGTTPAIYSGASGTYYAWNAAYTSHDYKNYTYSTSTSSKILSSITSNKIYYDQQNVMQFWHRGFGTRQLKDMQVVAYDSTGSTLQATLIRNQQYLTAFINYANVSPSGLELIRTNYPGDITTIAFPLLPIIPTNTAYYDIDFLDGSVNVACPIFRYYIDFACGRYERAVLHFLNRLGGYDCFVFNKVRRFPFSKETIDYKRFPFELDTSNNYTYDVEKPDTVTYSTTVTNKLVLNSDWLTEAQSSWLLDMFTSPDIKYEDENGDTFSVKITDKDYEVKKKVNDKLIQIVVNLEFSYQDIRQRG